MGKQWLRECIPGHLPNTQDHSRMLEPREGDVLFNRVEESHLLSALNPSELGCDIDTATSLCTLPM